MIVCLVFHSDYTRRAMNHVSHYEIDHLRPRFPEGGKPEHPVSLKNCVTPSLLEQPTEVNRNSN